MTSLGLLMMNKGDAMAGNGRFARTGGSLDMKTPEKISVYCARRNASNGVGAATRCLRAGLSRSETAPTEITSPCRSGL
jgi:hypothetical protein